MILKMTPYFQLAEPMSGLSGADAVEIHGEVNGGDLE
jgi:hypothetical protein